MGISLLSNAIVMRITILHHLNLRMIYSVADFTITPYSGCAFVPFAACSAFNAPGANGNSNLTSPPSGL